MQAYLDLLQHIRTHGQRKPTRTILPRSNEPLDALSIFGYQMRLSLEEGFPLLTTKKVHFRSVVHELIWFLQGSTNIRYLKEHGVTIWDEWADENGDLGPVYGKQWRRWQCPDGSTIDQIQQLIDGIEAVKADPRASVGRRLILNAWNVADISKMALPPCHTMSQFMLTEGKLSCQLYQRSADVFLGVPFNIASYALLTHILAHVTGVGVGEFIHTFGDVHIYMNHTEQVEKQMQRRPRPLPTLSIDPKVRSLEQLRFEHVHVHNYNPHPGIKAEVAV